MESGEASVVRENRLVSEALPRIGNDKTAAVFRHRTVLSVHCAHFKYVKSRFGLLAD